MSVQLLEGCYSVEPDAVNSSQTYDRHKLPEHVCVFSLLSGGHMTRASGPQDTPIHRSTHTQIVKKILWGCCSRFFRNNALSFSQNQNIHKLTVLFAAPSSHLWNLHCSLPRLMDFELFYQQLCMKPLRQQLWCCHFLLGHGCVHTVEL